MMNKAEKREIEVMQLKSIYNLIEREMDFYKRDIEYHENNMKDALEQNPEYDCGYYLGEIELDKLHIKTCEKVQEAIFKMM